MSTPPPDARSSRSELVSVRATGTDGVVLRLTPEAPIPALRPGRFFMLRREDGLSPAIPRPLSLYRQTDGDLEFLVKVVGPGTRALAESAPGTRLRTVGPLGNGWPVLGGEGPPIVAIGGGIGSAPFYELLRQAPAGNPTLIYGARTAGFLYDLEDFLETGVRVLAATDDGSQGFHGNVVQCLEQQWSAGTLPERVRLLCCGPEPMMDAVRRLAESRDLECYLSLETTMGCGVGICNGCAVPTAPDGPLGDWPVAKCCVDGPVFDARALRKA